VLAAGTAASTSNAAFGIGLPVLAPALRDSHGLSLGEIGLVFAAEWTGSLLTLFVWGLLTDRFGERRVLALGLGLCGVFLIAAGRTSGFAGLALLVGLAAATGGSVNSASGRAVMHWFGREERGLALGIRQTAIPAGGLVAAVVLPMLDVEGAFMFLGGFCLLGALVGALFLREGADDLAEVETTAPWTLRDSRLWILCGASGLYLVAQVALIGFVVLFLHDERGFSTGEAAAVLAAVQVGAAVLRIAAGRWSDVLRSRVTPLRRIGLGTCGALALATALLYGPTVALIPALVVSGALSMAWNGLSFTAAAELAGRARSGAAIGVQQSGLALAGVIAPVAFAAAVSATSWRAAYALAALFPLAGWRLLAPLAGR
jgi:sugar phosphate permease